MNRKYISLPGSAALIFGTFLPLVTVPFFGGFAYINGDGKIIVALAIIGAILALFNLTVFASLTAWLSMAVLCFTWWNVSHAAMPDNVIAQALIRSIQPGAGAATLVLGFFIMVVAAALPKEERL